MPALTLVGYPPVIFPDDSTAVEDSALENVPETFAIMSSLSYSIGWTFEGGYTNDEYTLGIRIVSGGLILAAANAAGAFVEIADRASDGVDSGTESGSFAYVSPSATKTHWNAATIEFQQTYSAVGGGDIGWYEIVDIDFSGIYVTGVTNVSAQTAQLTLESFPVELYVEYNIAANNAELLLETFPAELDTATTVNATLAELVLQKFNATVSIGVPVSATLAELTLETFPVTIFAEGEIGINAPAELELVSFAALVDVGDLVHVEASLAELVLTAPAAFVRDYHITEIEEPIEARWAGPPADLVAVDNLNDAEWRPAERDLYIWR